MLSMNEKQSKYLLPTFVLRERTVLVCIFQFTGLLYGNIEPLSFFH